jgi:hypothetical protein
MEVKLTSVSPMEPTEIPFLLLAFLKADESFCFFCSESEDFPRYVVLGSVADLQCQVRVGHKRENFNTSYYSAATVPK